MKPGHIQVFDGLRLTTEHIHHVQGAFHTAIQEIRRILGVGKVYYGFEIIKKSEDQITVTPGLAFDFNENRITCTEPATIDVVFKDDCQKLYVCLRYNQVQEGISEGIATLIYDSCLVLIQPECPESGENLIPIGMLKRNKEGTDFFITPQKSDGATSSPEIGIDEDKKIDDIDIAEKANLGTNSGDSEEKSIKLKEPEEHEPIEIEAGSIGRDERVSVDMTQPVVEESHEAVSENKFQHDVVQLNPEPTKKLPLAIAIEESLKNRHEAESEQVYVRIAELSSIELPIPNQFNLLVAEIVLNAVIGVEAEHLTEGETSLEWQYLVTGNGNAVMEHCRIDQNGKVMLHGKDGETISGYQLINSEIIRDSILRFRFSPFSKLPDEQYFLTNLGVDIRLQQDENGLQHLVTSVIWKGELSKTITDKAMGYQPYLMWKADAAWKVF